MSSLYITMLFWDAGEPTRLENVRLCWRRLLHLADYCAGHGVPIRPILYDFSPTPVLSGARSIPYPRGTYLKAEKSNRVLADLADDPPRFIAVMDADLIIREGEYPLMVRRLAELSERRYYVSLVDDLEGRVGVDYEAATLDESKLMITPRRRLMMGDLGGLYVAPYDALRTVGGFDEHFTVWGGEDNAAALALRARGLRPAPLMVRPLHLPHPSLEGAVMGGAEYDEQLARLTEYQRARALDAPPVVVPPGFLLAAARGVARGESVEIVCRRLLADGVGGEVLDGEVRAALRAVAARLWGGGAGLPPGSERWPLATLAPLLLWRLVASFELYRECAALLGGGAVPGRMIDGGRLFAMIARLYGRRAAVPLAEGFLATLAAFGVVARREGGRWWWRGRLAVAREALPHLLMAIADDNDLPFIDPVVLAGLPELALFDLSLVKEGGVDGGCWEWLGERKVFWLPGSRASVTTE